MSEDSRPWIVVQHTSSNCFFLNKEGDRYLSVPQTFRNERERLRWCVRNLMWFPSKVEAHFVARSHSEDSYDGHKIYANQWYCDMAPYFKELQHEQ